MYVVRDRWFQDITSSANKMLVYTRNLRLHLYNNVATNNVKSFFTIGKLLFCRKYSHNNHFAFWTRQKLSRLAIDDVISNSLMSQDSNKQYYLNKSACRCYHCYEIWRKMFHLLLAHYWIDIWLAYHITFSWKCIPLLHCNVLNFLQL